MIKDIIVIAKFENYCAIKAVSVDKRQKLGKGVREI